MKSCAAATVTSLLLVLVSTPAESSDRDALEMLFDATGGAGWTDSANWKTSASLGEWYGVDVDAGGRVIGLSLTGNGLAGRLPPELGDLTELRWLYLGANRLVGAIPSELGRLRNLVGLSLSWNEFDRGPVPAWLADLGELRWLYLSGTSRTGPIPAGLARLEHLEWLYLNSNDLAGPIPAWLGSLAKLERLYLGWNELAGSVPASLEGLTSLEKLSLSGNWGLTGVLPQGLLQLPISGLALIFTQVCAQVAWWQADLEWFDGQLCGFVDVLVEVAVVYTPAAREAAGGTAGISALVDLMVAEANQAYLASGVRHRIALAGLAETAYTEAEDMLDDLDRLMSPDDGYMDEVYELRDRVGADLLHLITDSVSDEWCGYANILGPFGLTDYACGGWTFTHELGHNLGLEHDRYEKRESLESHPGYGYVNRRAFDVDAPSSSRWRTIMSYNTQCADAGFQCPQLLRFSSPQFAHNGDPMGVPYGEGSGLDGPADALSVMTATAAAIALWRDPPPANRPPVVVGTLPDLTLAPGGIATVDVSRAFTDPDGDRLGYTVSSSNPAVVTATVSGPRVTLTAAGRTGSSTIWVTARDPENVHATLSFRASVATQFTDDPIVSGVTPVRAVHFTELRRRVDALRREVGLGPFRWVDPVLVSGVTRVRLQHLMDLRWALGDVYSTVGRTEPRWSDPNPVGGSTPIRSLHVNELRDAVRAIEAGR